MRIIVEHHHYFHDSAKEVIHSIIKKLDTIMANQTELAQQITTLTDQVNKSKAEITNKLATLEDAIKAAGNTTLEVDAALASLKTAVQGVDDIVPDAPAAEVAQG